MLGWRIALISGGILLGLYGVFRLVTEEKFHNLVILAFWLIGAVVIHDGILAPLTVSVGWFIGKVVPPRARRYLQAALILLQNYGAHLSVVLGLIAGVSLLLYAAQVARDRQRHPSGRPSGSAPDAASQ